MGGPGLIHEHVQSLQAIARPPLKIFLSWQLSTGPVTHPAGRLRDAGCVMRSGLLQNARLRSPVGGPDLAGKCSPTQQEEGSFGVRPSTQDTDQRICGKTSCLTQDCAKPPTSGPSRGWEPCGVGLGLKGGRGWKDSRLPKRTPLPPSLSLSKRGAEGAQPLSLGVLD